MMSDDTPELILKDIDSLDMILRKLCALVQSLNTDFSISKERETCQ